MLSHAWALTASSRLHDAPSAVARCSAADVVRSDGARDGRYRDTFTWSGSCHCRATLNQLLGKIPRSTSFHHRILPSEAHQSLTDLTHLLHPCSSSIHRRVRGSAPRCSHFHCRSILRRSSPRWLDHIQSHGVIASASSFTCRVESAYISTACSSMASSRPEHTAHSDDLPTALVPRFAGGLGMLDEHQVRWPSTQIPADRHRADTCMCCA